MSIATFLASLDCFIGKISDVEEMFEEVERAVQGGKTGEYDYILQHFYFWSAMGFFNKKMFAQSQTLFLKARKIKKTELSISDKVEKNLILLKAFPGRNQRGGGNDRQAASSQEEKS